MRNVRRISKNVLKEGKNTTESSERQCYFLTECIIKLVQPFDAQKEFGDSQQQWESS